MSYVDLTKKTLCEVCAISGRKVNVGKYKLYVSRNRNRVVEMALSSELGIPLTLNLGKYLEFPIIHGWVTKRKP